MRLTAGNNCEGMNSDTLERIFDPFFTTRGVGIGTTIEIYFPQADARLCLPEKGAEND